VEDKHRFAINNIILDIFCTTAWLHVKSSDS